MKILLAVSGGIDSVVLLNLLVKKKLAKFTGKEIPKIEKIVVASFNHAIHTKADAHEKFVRQLAGKYDLEFFSEKARKNLASEAQARDARYAFLEKIMKRERCDLVALAHHAGDQIETILLNLIRGSGMQGLSGMQEISGNKWRPLLQISKSKIENYAKRNHLKFVKDPTNLELKYSRNFLRKEILPKLEALNPKFEVALVRTSKIARENMDLISMLAKEWLRRFAKVKSVELTEFASLPVALKREVIREIYLAEIGDLQKIEEKHLAEIVELSQNLSGNKQKKFGKLVFKTAKRGGVRVLEWR